MTRVIYTLKIPAINVMGCITFIALHVSLIYIRNKFKKNIYVGLSYLTFCIFRDKIYLSTDKFGIGSMHIRSDINIRKKVLSKIEPWPQVVYSWNLWTIDYSATLFWTVKAIKLLPVPIKEVVAYVTCLRKRDEGLTKLMLCILTYFYTMGKCV